MTRTAAVAGVGPGLGAAIARRFAAEGCRVALLARTESYLDSLAAELADTAGEGLAVPTDLTDAESVEAAFETVRETWGPTPPRCPSRSTSRTGRAAPSSSSRRS